MLGNEDRFGLAQPRTADVFRWREATGEGRGRKIVITLSVFDHHFFRFPDPLADLRFPLFYPKIYSYALLVARPLSIDFPLPMRMSERRHGPHYGFSNPHIIPNAGLGVGKNTRGGGNTMASEISGRTITMDESMEESD